MVSVLGAGIGIVLIIVFLSAGGIGAAKAFGEKVKRATAPDTAESSVDIAGGEATIVSPDSKAPEIVTAGVMERKGTNQLVTTIAIQPRVSEEVKKSLSGGAEIVRGSLLLEKPTPELTTSLTGVGTSQFSTGQVGILSDAARAEIASRELTQQQREDVLALDARRAAAIARGINPNIKLSGAELVQRKAEQEELSKVLLTSRFGGQTFVGGKLFANPLFETGGR